MPSTPEAFGLVWGRYPLPASFLEVDMTTDQRMDKQRELRQYAYARRLVKDRTGMYMDTFELHAGQRGDAWKIKIWKLRCEIVNDDK